MLTIAALTFGVLAFSALAQESCKCTCNSQDQGSVDVSDCGSCTSDLCTSEFGSCQGSQRASCSSGGGGSSGDDDESGFTVTWTGSPSEYVSAFYGYWVSSEIDETYCITGSTVTGQIELGTLVFDLQDSTRAISSGATSDIIFVVGPATINGYSIGFLTFVSAKEIGNTYLASGNAKTSLADARETGVQEAFSSLLDGGRAAFNKGSSSTCNSAGGGGSGSSLAASVMAGGLLTAGVCLAGGAVVGL